LDTPLYTHLFNYINFIFGSMKAALINLQWILQELGMADLG